MVCVVSLCLILCSWMFAFCHAFAFICCVCDFMVELKSVRMSELVSIVSLSLNQRFLQECSGICPQGVRDCRVQIEVAFVLSLRECRFGTGAVQGVRRLEEDSELRF
jgi:hypothetical protein